MKPEPTREETLKALDLSIEKWERFANGTPHEFDTIYAETCPLCRLFVLTDKMKCDGCPIWKRTQRHRCNGTPWGLVGVSAMSGYESSQFRKASASMLDYLRETREIFLKENPV